MLRRYWLVSTGPLCLQKKLSLISLSLNYFLSGLGNGEPGAIKGMDKELVFNSFTSLLPLAYPPDPSFQGGSGMCMSPIHVTSSQLISSDIFPVPVIKALLYPGAIVNVLATNMTFPKWEHVLDIYNLTSVKEASAVPDLQRPEVLAGSYFSVAGAFVGLLKPGRMSMFGSLLLVWGLVKEGILKKPVNTDPAKTVYMYPTMVIAMICAFSMIKYDLKKASRAAPARPIAKPLMSSSKSKLK